MYLIGFPLLVIPFAIYNMIAFLTPGIGWTDKVASIHLMSGKDWTVTTEDILLVVAILLLTLEILKATRMSSRAIVDHILSMILFIAMLVEFLLVAPAGTSTFFLLTVLSLVDVMAGFIVTVRTAQRDLQIERVDTLSGPPRSTFRRNDLVMTFLPEAKLIRSERRENFDVFDFELDGDDVNALTELDRDHRTGPDPDRFNP